MTRAYNASSREAAAQSARVRNASRIESLIRDSADCTGTSMLFKECLGLSQNKLNDAINLLLDEQRVVRVCLGRYGIRRRHPIHSGTLAGANVVRIPNPGPSEPQ